MYVCPFDMAWCNRPECRTGACELTGESPFIPCVLCGVLIAGPIVTAACEECVVVDLADDNT
jgi:hypothetical protein